MQTKRTQVNGTEQIAAPLIVHEVLRSPGQPINPVTRAFMESRFGRDFGHVQVHTNEQAAESARAVRAMAYTVGNDIVFGRGRYAPEQAGGKRLLAHEMAHVVQQTGPAGEGRFSPPLLQRSPDPDRQLALESARCPRPSTGTTFAVAPGSYSTRGLTLPYDRVVPEPDPTRGVDNSEVLRIIQEPDRLEQLYFDATHGNQRAAWLVYQLEAGARSIGRQSAQHLNSLACQTVMSCSVQFERLPFSESTASGLRIRTVIGDAFVQEPRRLQLRNEIIGHALMLLVGVSIARGVLARGMAAAETIAVEAEIGAGRRTVQGGAAQEGQAVRGGGTSAAVSGGTASGGEATVSGPAGGQNVLIVGAETAEEFAYARHVAARGGNVTVVNPAVTGEARAFMRSGGRFVQARIEDLPRQPGFDLIREDFPFPTGRAFTPAASFIQARLARLAPGGRWVVMTESAEFAETVEGVARLRGATVRGTCVAPYHEAVPASAYPRDIGRYVLIIEGP